MPCYAPLRAVLVSTPEGRRISFSRFAYGKGLSLPCGRCIGCRLERARQWAVRIMHESKMHISNSFVTLTYDQEHIPSGGSLSVEDCQLFLKRLRARIAPVRIRFFLAGEYGERLLRPHYHAVIFGFDFPDKILLKSRCEFLEWTSPLLSECWGKGLIHIGSLTFDSACYVANYATKKITGAPAKAHYQGRKPEFTLMSRGGRKAGGIGRSWIEQFHGDVYPSDQVIVRGIEARPPRYYDNFLESRNLSMFEGLKLKREAKAVELEKELVYDVVSYKKAAAMLVSGYYPSDKRLIVLKNRQCVAQAKAALKTRNLERVK